MPEVTDTYEFAVEGTPEILVRNRAGSIVIARGAARQVSVRVTKRAQGRLLGRLTEDDLARLIVNVTQQDNHIRVETDQRDLGFSLKNCQVDITITAPAESNLDLHMNAGNVEIRDITGVIASVINAGNFDALHMLLAGHSTLTVNAGNLMLEGAVTPGAALDAEVNAGNLVLRLPHETPAYLEALVHVGSIDVGGWPISVSRRVVRQEATGALGNNPQGTLRLRVNSGSISMRAA